MHYSAVEDQIFPRASKQFGNERVNLQPVQNETPEGLTVFSTKFGCVISGLVPDVVPVCHIAISSPDNEQFNLARFWENEDLPAVEASDYTQDEVFVNGS